MSTPEAGSNEPGGRPSERRSAAGRPARALPPARRNQKRRARRAARLRAQREQRRRESERRLRERERHEERTEPSAEPAPAHAVEAPPAAPVVSPAAPSAPPAPFAPSTGERPGPQAPPPAREQAPRPVPRPGRPGRRRVTVRKVDPWSVFRLSLVLYFCLLVVVTFGLVIFWVVLSRVPVLQRTLEVVEQLGILVDPSLVLTILVPVGLLNVLLWSAANLFFAILYNLVADLVGGLRVTLSEE